MFDKIKDHIEKNNIFINHYCTPDNIEQTSEFITTKNIKIFSLDEMPKNKKIIDLWIGSNDYANNFFNSNDSYNDFLLKFYNNILKEIDIPITIDDFVFEDDEIIHREKTINERTNNKYKNIDFLFMNGAPRSGQINYDEKEWDDIIKRFADKHNVVTTQKIEGIKCTRDDNLSVKDISAVARNAKKIIAIDSGPASGLFNKHLLKNIEKVYYLCEHEKCRTSFNNFIYKRNISDVLFLLNDDEPLKESMCDRSSSNNHSYVFYTLLTMFIALILFLCYYNSLAKKMYNRLSKLLQRFFKLRL